MGIFNTGDRVPAPRPLDSIAASAARIRGSRVRSAKPQAWQDEAWDLYDQTGELRFVANLLAHAVSSARIFAAVAPTGREEAQAITDETTEPDAKIAAEVMEEFGGGALARSQMLRRSALHMFVPGDGFLVGLPAGLMADTPSDDPTGLRPTDTGTSISDLSWHALSVSEVAVTDDSIQLSLGDGQPIRLDHAQATAVRVWRPHPRRWWQADSPTRSNLPVLRELIGLTKHVSATIDSRLSSAGILVLPQSVEIAASPVEDPDGDSTTPFIDTLIDIAAQALEDRDSAAAVVPLVVKVADEIAAQIGQDNLIRFNTPFDEHARALRDEAIRRLALGLDSPPEMLLGMGSVNHWGQWLIKEETLSVHVDPVLALLCDAVTTQWLWPVLEQRGVVDPQRFVAWWDLSAIKSRPNRFEEAQALHTAGAIGDVALRREADFPEDDAPDVDVAVQTALDLVRAAPSLVASPGLPALVEQIRQITGTGSPMTVSTGDSEEPVDAEGGMGLPDTDDGPPGFDEA